MIVPSILLILYLYTGGSDAPYDIKRTKVRKDRALPLTPAKKCVKIQG